MRNLDNFARSLDVLKRADRDAAVGDDIYRMGVIGQFNLTFELAWKALKAVLLLYGVDAAKTGSPREVLKEGYSAGMLSDANIWLDMMRRRNIAVHVYDHAMALELIDAIFFDFTPAFEHLFTSLSEKLSATSDSF